MLICMQQEIELTGMIWGWILETASLPSLDNPSLSGDNNTKAHRAARSANEMFSELSIFNDLQLN